MKLYVKAKSKKDINERLEKGEAVFGDNFSAFGGGGTYQLGGQPIGDGTVIAIYEKTATFPGESGPGSPVAKTYGAWDAKKGRVK
jgi:hypothetical protein